MSTCLFSECPFWDCGCKVAIDECPMDIPEEDE